MNNNDSACIFFFFFLNDTKYNLWLHHLVCWIRKQIPGNVRRSEHCTVCMCVNEVKFDMEADRESRVIGRKSAWEDYPPSSACIGLGGCINMTSQTQLDEDEWRTLSKMLKNPLHFPFTLPPIMITREEQMTLDNSLTALKMIQKRRKKNPKKVNVAAVQETPSHTYKGLIRNVLQWWMGCL